MALTNLKQIYKDRGRSFIENLFTKYVIVTEQLDGSRLMVMKNTDGTIVFMKKDGSPINFIDRTMMVFYEKAIEHFHELGLETVIKMPDNWVFGFQYFPSLAPVNIVYDRLPKNNLVLTDIQISNGEGRILKTISDPRVLSDWSKTLDVERPPIIYNGNLTSVQKDRIMDYLSTPESDLMATFKSQSFTRYIISVLNPDIRTSSLMNDIDKPIEGIIFKFITPGESEVYSARLIDPVMQQHSKNITKPVDRKANDMYQIAMLDIIEFMELVDMTGIQLNSESPDERYIELMSVLFNDYIQKNGHKYIGVDFETPDFAKKPEFEINLATIPNERTREILKNSKLSDLFKIIISSFRRYRKNTTPILTQQIVDTLNGIIEKIQKKVEMVPEENQILDFNNYLKRSQIENVTSVFESIINEALKLNTTEHGSKKVNIFAGRFQPFTEGHMKVVEQLYKENGLPTFILIVRGGKADPAKNPFDEDTQLAMIGAIQSNMIEGAAVINTAGIDTIYNAVRPAYEPVLWGAGTDRLKAYKYQIDKYKEELNALPELDAFEIKRSDEDISATKVREALKIDDEATFKRMTPKGMHKLYDQLKTIMQEVKENFSLLTFNQFINESRSVNESLSKNASAGEVKSWVSLYDSWSSKKGFSGRPVDVKIAREILRCPFGGFNDAPNNIKEFLTFIGVPEKSYNVQVIAPRSSVRLSVGNINKISGSFYGYVITFNKKTVIGSTTYEKGDDVIITDNNKTGKSGEVGKIGKKDLTPDALSLSGGTTFESVASQVNIEVGKTQIPDEYKSFISDLITSIKTDASNGGAYEDINNFLEAALKSNVTQTYSIVSDYTQDIDASSLSNIANDFGEVLGGLHMFHTLRNTGSGLSYPTSSNEKLVDFYFDGAEFSSKAGKKGGTPAATGPVTKLKDKVNAGTIVLTGAQSKFYDDVLMPILDLSAQEFYIEMANKYLYSKGEAWHYFLEESGLSEVTKDNVSTWLDKLYKNKKKFIAFYDTLWSKCGSRPDVGSTEAFYDDWENKTYDYYFYAIMYPLSTTVVKYLNSNYGEVLTDLIQKAVDVLQAYLIVKIKSNEMTFVTKALGSASFSFEPKGSVGTGFNSKIGLTSGSV